MPKSKMKISATMIDGFRTTIQGSYHRFIIDQPEPASGNEAPNPLEYFLSSIAGCICTIGRIIAKQKRFELRSIDVEIEADIDKDYLMGKTTAGRAGFTEIRALTTIDADLTDEEKADLLKQIELRCPIADNITNTSNLVVSLKK